MAAWAIRATNRSSTSIAIIAATVSPRARRKSRSVASRATSSAWAARRSAMKAEKRPVRPRDAASLVLLREGKRGLEVLIGRRGKGARFMPGRYVFPGGRVTADDARLWVGEPDDDTRQLRALKHAALR